MKSFALTGFLGDRRDILLCVFCAGYALNARSRKKDVSIILLHPCCGFSEYLVSLTTLEWYD